MKIIKNKSKKMKLNKKISQSYNFDFEVNNPGLVAIFVSAKCRAKDQTGLNTDEDLRMQLNGLNFREIPSQKNIQLFNVPPAFNGACARGNKKTVVFFTSLNKGEHQLNLISKNSAFIEEIKIQELSGKQDVELVIDEKTEDCNNFPWYSFVLVDLPLNYLSVDFMIEKRFRDSDDVKIIIDGIITKSIFNGKFKYWYLIGGLLKLFFREQRGEKKEMNINLSPKLDSGMHYIEFWADRMPTFCKIKLSFQYAENKSSVRAANLIGTYAPTIKDVSKEFKVDPIIIGAVIYQEQSTNVNFIDTLTDYVGGLLHINTSIGIGQVRVQTAKLLEDIYPTLNPLDKKNDPWADSNTVRVERLKDPWTNIRYVAAKIKFDQDRWNNAGLDLKDRPEILGTLYNIENINNPIEPSTGAESNNFGIGVKENYGKVKKLLGL